MHKDNMGSIVTVEAQILSLFHSKIYFSNYDFVEIGKKLNIELAPKTRELTLKNLITSAQANNSLKSLYVEFIKVIDSRLNEYRKLSSSYEKSSVVVSQWIQKADILKSQILKRLEKEEN